MKKKLVILLAVLMLASAALAGEVQTRESVILLEGCEETIVEARYESPNGYVIWYPVELFAACHEEGADYFDSDPTIIDVGVSIVTEAMSCAEVDELLAATIEHALANNGAVPGEVEEWQLESGVIVKHVDIIWEDGYGPVYYLYGNGRVFCVSCYYPTEAAEGIGACVERMISTFAEIE